MRGAILMSAEKGSSTHLISPEMAGKGCNEFLSLSLFMQTIC